MTITLLKAFITTVLFNMQISGEVAYPEAGKTCPEFVLRNIKYYDKKEATLQNFRGKWLVLDFWNKVCGACVASFPKTSALQKEFGDRVQFMLVGIEDEEGQIEPMYKKFKEKEGLIMPCAFDSNLAKQWDIYTAPYIIVIDPDGKVQTITHSINADDIQAFLAGKHPRLPKAYRMHEDEIDTLISYDKSHPLLINGNGGDDTAFLFRSVLSAFDVKKQHFSIPAAIADDVKQGRFQTLGAPLYLLYNYAYLGVARPNRDSGYINKPILEVRDSAFFQFSGKYDKNVFCYSLSLPPSLSTKGRMQEMMRRDLENYFPFAVNLEERKFPCWRLITTSEETKHRLKSKGGIKSFKSIIPKVEFIAQNWPFNIFLNMLKYYSENDIVDGTGITDNIDIHMNCLLTDINDVKRELQTLGLDLIPSERIMKVLVIRNKAYTEIN